MARLKLCLMTHYEDDLTWANGSGPSDVRLMAALATIVGKGLGPDGLARGAKISMQSDLTYLDQNAAIAHPYPYPSAAGAPTSLKMLFQNGGNLWCHTHSATAEHLTSVQVCVTSALGSEISTGYTDAKKLTAGRSGGPDIADSTLDWLSITQGLGILKMNAPTVANYSTMIESLRPYGMDLSGAEGKAYQHSGMPGPLDDAIPATMRQRPFWMTTASIWDAGVSCIYPKPGLISSVIMIPQPSRISALDEFSGARTAAASEGLTMEDFNAALTNIWTTWQLMTIHQASISNVWYVHVTPDLISSTYLDTFGAWVDSINNLMNVNTTNATYQRAEWRNMNEIADLFSHATSCYY